MAVEENRAKITKGDAMNVRSVCVEEGEKKKRMAILTFILLFNFVFNVILLEHPLKMLGGTGLTVLNESRRSICL